MASENTFYPTLTQSIKDLDIRTIPEKRLPILQALMDYIQEKKESGAPIHLNFICTHNSRRSHLAQVWAQTLAAYYQLSDVHCYSGGTEATALFPMVAKTLEGQGFQIERTEENTNPTYEIRFAIEETPIIGYSKTYDAPDNPKTAFAAIMTCSQADEGCPFIPGAEKRIALTYDDPKEFDNTPLQAAKYLERSKQIATELKYVFSNSH